jgi:hypothetical protein
MMGGISSGVLKDHCNRKGVEEEQNCPNHRSEAGI